MEAQTLRWLLQLSGASLSDGSFVLSLHPDGSRLAVARGPALFVCPLLPATSREAAAAGEPGTTDGTGPPDEQQQALRERQATHGSAGPRSGAAAPGTPLRFACKGDSGPGAICQDDITAMAWLAFARPPSAPQGGSPERGRSGGGGGGGGDGVDGDHHGLQGRAVRDHRRTTSSGGSGGVFASIQVMMEDHELQRQQQAVHRQPHSGYSLVVLLSGTRGGALQLHDADSGAVLLRQQLHPGPVVSIAVRTWRVGLDPSEAVEDVTVGWADAVARLAAWELRAAATTCYAAAAAAAEARARGGGGGGQARFGLWGSSSLSSAPPGPDIKPLAVQKWEVPPGAARGRSCVVCCGQRPRDLYSLLQAVGPASSTATGKTIFLAGGNKPACLAALEVDEQSSGGGGTLSYISSVATSVWGLARTARNVAAAPLALGGGLKYLMNPFQLAGGGGGDASAGGGGGSGGSPGAAPLASFPDAIAGQRLPSTGVWRQHRDDGRAVLALAPAPHGSLVAAVDSLGRVLLVEMGAMLVSRMWKGYRDAQVVWMEARASSVAALQERQRAERCSSQSERQQPQPRQQPGAAASGAQAPAAALEGSGGGGSGGASHAEKAARSERESTSADAHGRGHERGPGPGRGLHMREARPSPQQHHVLSQQQQQAARQPHSQRLAVDGAGSGGGGEYVLLLAVYAPRRQTLELWFPLQGERLAVVAAPPKARLLQRGGGGSGGGGELGTWRVADAASAASPPMSPTGCMMCFAGAAPALEFGVEAEPAGAGCGEGLELLDVGSVFGLA